jgi:hypothetical protein
MRLVQNNRPELTFPRFWGPFPRKVAKKDAMKAWDELNPDETLIVVIVAALAWQTELIEDVKYFPYPATWLRAERWTDEKPQAVTPKTTPELTRFASLGMHREIK